MFETWGQTPSALYGWKYAQIYEESQQRFVATLPKWLASKAVLRIAIAVAGVLTLFTFLWLGKPSINDYYYRFPTRLETQLDHGTDVDWTQYAYCQYVTNKAYLCNSVMIFESLSRLEAKAERLMMYPEEWIVGGDSVEGRLLAKARDEYAVRLVPIRVQHFNGGSPTWADSFTKLLAFNQTIYKRVLSLDSDSTILKPMDELFLLPSAPVAMPRAYWLDEHFLSSQLVLVEPSEFEWARIEAALESRGDGDFDMEIVNQLYGDSCFIIPHRRYDLLTGEFKGKDHHKYLGTKEEVWDPDAALEEAKYLHFSDWPYPKPWIEAGKGLTEQHQPGCNPTNGGEPDCRNREKWLWAYSDFRARRERVCEAQNGQ